MNTEPRYKSYLRASSFIFKSAWMFMGKSSSLFYFWA